MGNLWMIAGGLVLLAVAFVAGMLFEKKNAAKIESTLNAAKQAVADAKKV